MKECCSKIFKEIEEMYRVTDVDEIRPIKTEETYIFIMNTSWEKLKQKYEAMT